MRCCAWLESAPQALGKHKGHHCTLLGNVADTERKELEAALPELKSRVEKLEARAAELTSVEATLAAANQNAKQQLEDEFQQGKHILTECDGMFLFYG